MKNLLEIAKIVTKKKARKIEIFDDHSLRKKNSKFNEFYKALQAGKFRNDLEAARYLYNCSPTDDRYRQLKSRFRKRLLNTLFFLDVNLPDTSNYDRAYFSSNKNWTLIRILQSNGAEHTAADLAQKLLRTALKFQFADVIVNCSRILRRYSARTGDKNGFGKYDEYIKQYIDILDAEIRSEEMYQRVKMDYLQIDGVRNDLPEDTDQRTDVLTGLSEVYDSPIIEYHLYLVWIMRYEIQYDYHSVIKICEKAEQYMKENPRYIQEARLRLFHLKRMTAYLHLRDFSRGRVAAEKSLQILKAGRDPWFEFMEYYLLLALHTEQFVTAQAVYNKATTHAKFRKLPTNVREKWRVFEVYLGYLVAYFGREKPMLRTQQKKTFRVQAFLKEPLRYQKEQEMISVLMLIARVLFLLEQRKYQDTDHQIEELRSYANRQLRKKKQYRTIQFIRLLSLLSKANYKVNQVAGTEKYYNRLIDQPMLYRGRVQELEVIPYDKLWNHILGSLMNRKW